MKHLAKNHRKRRRNRWFLCSILLSFSRLVDCHAPTAAEEDELPPIATSTVPMHAVSGTHHIYVYIGSPPKRQTLIVDTGSRIMAFPCDPCKNCGRHTSPTYYSPLESTTDVQLPCDRCHYDMSVRHRFSVNMYLQYVHTCIANRSCHVTHHSLSS